MLRLRPEQLEAFEAAQQQKFVDETVPRVAATWPAKYAELGEQGARSLVEQGLSRARGYGIEDDEDLGRFVDLLFTVHPEFETQDATAWTMDILEDEEISGAAKVALVADGMSGEQS